jgi:hypothetical protein
MSGKFIFDFHLSQFCSDLWTQNTKSKAKVNFYHLNIFLLKHFLLATVLEVSRPKSIFYCSLIKVKDKAIKYLQQEKICPIKILGLKPQPHSTRSDL